MPGARIVIRRMLVVPAEAGIQRLKSLDPGQKHAGMTIKWDSNGIYPFNVCVRFPWTTCYVRQQQVVVYG